MKTRKDIIIIFFALFFIKGKAQNLVPNPDFETHVECPDTSFLPFHALLDSTWYQFGSADYFNACDTSDYYGVPENFIGGNQFAYSGNAYTGLQAYNPVAFNREYIEVKLISSLVAGQVYYVQFFVSLPDEHQYAIENMGALFTDTLFDPYPPPIGTWLTGVPQVENPVGNILDDKINWMAVSGSFIAAGGEKYVTISNFKDDANTVNQYLGSTSGTQATYYYIDDVYVGLTPPPVGIHENVADNHNIKMFPNPSNGTMTLECNLTAKETGILFIYDLNGRLIHKQILSNGSKIAKVDVEKLDAGVYIYELIVNEQSLKKDKLTIIK